MDFRIGEFALMDFNLCEVYQGFDGFGVQGKGSRDEFFSCFGISHQHSENSEIQKGVGSVLAEGDVCDKGLVGLLVPSQLVVGDAEVCAGNGHHRFPYTREGAEKFIQYAHTTEDEIILAMVLKESNRHIGNLALKKLDLINRTAELAILVGEKDCWGKGYSKEACKLIMAHGFQILQLNRIACGTFSTNEGMIRLAAALGMKEEGRRREAVFKEGQYLDVIEFGILRSEWSAKA